jgi:hypothetical protein
MYWEIASRRDSSLEHSEKLTTGSLILFKLIGPTVPSPRILTTIERPVGQIQANRKHTSNLHRPEKQ